MSSFEKKFGKYAIRNLSLVLVICYAVGYAIYRINPGVLYYLTLDTYKILHGQIWRLFTWLLIPPSGYSVFSLLIMMMFYYSIGSALESVWGTYRYNVYLFSGMIFTIAGAFIVMGLFYLVEPRLLNSPEYAEALFRGNSLAFSTVYVNMSIFLAFAVTFPNAQVRLMFVIPVKVKWLGYAYGAMLLLEFITASGLISRIIMVASLLNFLLFWWRSRGRMRISPKQVSRRQKFRSEVKRGTKISRHKCAVCGRSEEDDPSLEFRFCSKCNGNYEYCQQHLFSHEHVK